MKKLVKITGAARPIEWLYRSKFFGGLINKTDYTYIYDFGCGYCELQTFIPTNIYIYIGIDAVAYTSDVLLCDLSRNFPGKFMGDRSNRLAVSLGLFEHLIKPFNLMQKILNHFDCLYFSYGQKNKRKSTIIDAVRFKILMEEFCINNHKRLQVIKIDNDPLEVKTLRPKGRSF